MNSNIADMESQPRARYQDVGLIFGPLVFVPLATPPNAIVFASGVVTIPQMVIAGVILNVFGMVLLTFVAIWLAPYVFL